MQRVVIKKWKDISLVVPEKSDISMWYKGMNDLEVQKNIITPFGYICSLEDEEKFYEKCNKQFKNTFCIYDHQKKKTIWNIGLNHMNFMFRNAELWIVLFDSTTRWKWIGQQAIELLLEYSFSHLWLNKIYLEVLGSNEIAINCYKKCGFEEVGRLKKHCYLGWEYHDKVIMEVFNPKAID